MEDEALRVVPHRREACADTVLTVATVLSECIRYEHCSCRHLPPHIRSVSQLRIPCRENALEMQLKRPRIAAGMRAKPPVCGLTDGDRGDKLVSGNHNRSLKRATLPVRHDATSILHSLFADLITYVHSCDNMPVEREAGTGFGRSFT